MIKLFKKQRLSVNRGARVEKYFNQLRYPNTDRSTRLAKYFQKLNDDTIGQTQSWLSPQR